MKRIFTLVGVTTLVAWTGLGLLAWQTVAKRVTILSSDAETSAGPSEVAVLSDRVDSLHMDVRALAKAMGEGLAGLHSELTASQDEHARALGNRMDALRGEVASQALSPSADRLDDLLRAVAALRARLEAAPVLEAPVQPVLPTAQGVLAVEPASATLALAVVEVAPSPPIPAEPAPAAKAKKSFLAFTLPSDDLRFDERRSWTLLPALSRVGFDAKTTLHDFTAKTSDLEGTLEAELAHPASAPRARIVAKAGELQSGDSARDEEMRERLAVVEHPTIEFELVEFLPAEIDAAAMRARGEARGRMTIRGVTEDVAMPVRIAVDEARRLTVEGEMALDLERFHVPVPNKLGLISMEKVVQVWVSLKFRAQPRSEG